MLVKIDKRLCQSDRSVANKPFGNKCIIFVGDIFQL